MQFEYYVLNYNFNKRKVEMFNIFNNIHVQEHTEKAVRTYLRAPKKYKHIVQYENKFLDREEIAIYGFDALVKEIDGIIRWQECGRAEYEMCCGYKFETDCNNLQSTDCYEQCKLNMEMITREVLWQYKKQLKEKGSE